MKLTKREQVAARSVGKGQRYLVHMNERGGIASLWAADYFAAEKIATELFGPRGWCLGTYVYDADGFASTREN